MFNHFIFLILLYLCDNLVICLLDGDLLLFLLIINNNMVNCLILEADVCLSALDIRCNIYAC